MIKFFRKIRQKLLSENKVSKYLVYAIGEILLVVIGILIALQVNNFNENRKASEREQKYLIAIKKELNGNLKVIKMEQIRLKESLASQRKLTALIDSKTDTLSEKKLSTILNQSISKEIILDYQNGTFAELINSGGLKDISNNNIRSQISSWDAKIINVKQQEEGLSIYKDKLFNYVVDFGDMRTVADDCNLSKRINIGFSTNNKSNKSLLNSQKFENLLMTYLVVGTILNESYYPKLADNIERLLEMVEKDLN